MVSAALNTQAVYSQVDSDCLSKFLSFILCVVIIVAVVSVVTILHTYLHRFRMIIKSERAIIHHAKNKSSLHILLNISFHVSW